MELSDLFITLRQQIAEKPLGWTISALGEAGALEVSVNLVNMVLADLSEEEVVDHVEVAAGEWPLFHVKCRVETRIGVLAFKLGVCLRRGEQVVVLTFRKEDEA